MIYADLGCLLEKMHSCENNPENFYTEKKLSIRSHGPTKNKLDCYKGEDCMKKFCEDLREHVTKTINYEKKKK